MPLIRSDILHHIERDRIFQIKRGEVNDIFQPRRRHIIQQFFRRRAVRVNKSQTAAVLNVLDGQIFQQGGFSHAGFTDDIKMPCAVFAFDAEFCPPAAKIRLGEIGYFLVRFFGHSDYIIHQSTNGRPHIHLQFPFTTKNFILLWAQDEYLE